MNSIDEFVARFDDFSDWPPTKQVDYVTFYLTADDELGVTGSDITEIFDALHLKNYKRVNSYLSENASRGKGKYIKVKSGGYRLTRAKHIEIEKLLDDNPAQVTVSKQLTDLVSTILDSNEKEFLEEAINCYKVQSFRAFIIMVWIVTVDHLQRYVFANELPAFNSALAASPDKKVKRIVNYDDFSDLQESKLIELCRSARIISNDVRKILDEKLGTRNSSGHPSGVKISGHKATEFALDLLNNVLLKY